MIGGFAEKALKKEYGDKLTSPDLLMVLASAMGLGATADNMYPCISEVLRSPGFILNMLLKEVLFDI